MIYTNVITVSFYSSENVNSAYFFRQTAQSNGLFCARDGQPLNDELFNQIPDLEARWKAWSRIECAKRYILLSLGCWTKVTDIFLV